MAKKEPEPQSEEKLTIADLLNAVNDTNTDEEVSPTTDIEFAHEVVGTLFDQSNINMITSLTKKELAGVNKLYLIKDILYGGGSNNVLSRFLQNYLTLKVSEHRQGRSELIRAILGTKDVSFERNNVFRKYVE